MQPRSSLSKDMYLLIGFDGCGAYNVPKADIPALACFDRSKVAISLKSVQCSLVEAHLTEPLCLWEYDVHRPSPLLLGVGQPQALDRTSSHISIQIIKKKSA